MFYLIIRSYLSSLFSKMAKDCDNFLIFTICVDTIAVSDNRINKTKRDSITKTAFTGDFIPSKIEI